MRGRDYVAAFERARAEIEELPPDQRARVIELFDEALKKQGEIVQNSGQIEEVARRLGHSAESFRECAMRLQDQLQDMRIAAKLLLLDLEAGRRERSARSESDEAAKD